MEGSVILLCVLGFPNQEIPLCFIYPSRIISGDIIFGVVGWVGQFSKMHTGGGRSFNLPVLNKTESIQLFFLVPSNFPKCVILY